MKEDAMMFMNEYEIVSAAEMFRDHPVLGPATRTLSNLRDAANANSDGWAYWPKPARAAAKLQQLIQDAERDFQRGAAVSTTPQAYKAALTPIKSFRTSSGIPFEIEEA